MSETTPQPLLYRMGVVVGQSIAAAKNQVQEEVQQELEQATQNLQQDVNLQNEKLDKILALVYAGL